MGRWYAAFRCVGRQAGIVQTINRVVLMGNMGKSVPVMRMERKPKGQFYLFLAVESPVRGDPPPQLMELIRNANLSPLMAAGNTRLVAFDLRDIRSMVSGELEFHEYARRIPYWRVQLLTYDDPFAADGQDSEPEVEIIERTMLYDRLMLWLSGLGTGSWQAFRGACQALGLDADGRQARRIFRRLRLLGHLEYSRDGDHWSVAPPVLVKIKEASDKEAYLLCGARDQQLRETLQQFGRLEDRPQSRGEGPAKICLWSDAIALDQSNLSQLGPYLRSGGHVATLLADALPTLDLWTDTLQEVQGIIPAAHDITRFDGERFVDTVFENSSGFYEFWPLRAQRETVHPKYLLFYDATTDRWLRGDWYGLRFLALRALGYRCPVIYHTDDYQLAFPEAYRWPELYERALVLSSGQLPHRNNGTLVYESIAPEVVELLERKLDLSVERP